MLYCQFPYARMHMKVLKGLACRTSLLQARMQGKALASPAGHAWGTASFFRVSFCSFIEKRNIPYWWYYVCAYVSCSCAGLLTAFEAAVLAE